MREELKESQLESVNGGVYKLNYNTRAVSFSTSNRAFFLTDDAVLMDIQKEFDSYIGKFQTMDQYDDACQKFLESNNLIKSVIR